MKTKKLSLLYKVTPNEVFPPSQKELDRKDRFMKSIKSSTKSAWEFQIVKVTYELYDPEIINQRRFFEGACVMYYAIQNMNMLKGTPGKETIEQYREEILDEMLGYDYKTVNKIVRMRKSTTDFKDSQAWLVFLDTLAETMFDSSGYEFPDSNHFWELVSKHGYEQSQRIVVEQLQARLARRVGDKSVDNGDNSQNENKK